MSIHGSEYVVKRDVPNWEPCPTDPPAPDTRSTGSIPWTKEAASLESTVLAGFDETVEKYEQHYDINKAQVNTAVTRLEKTG